LAARKKTPFLIQLLEIIKEHTRIFFLQGVYKSDFESVLPEFPGIDKSPYNMCCEMNAFALSNWARKSPHRKEYVLFFEKRDRFMSETIELFKRAKGVNSITQIDKNSASPLQAADLLAYEIYKQCRRHLEDESRLPRKSLMALLKGMKIEGGLHDPETIRHCLKFALDYRSALRSSFPKLCP